MTGRNLPSLFPIQLPLLLLLIATLVGCNSNAVQQIASSTTCDAKDVPVDLNLAGFDANDSARVDSVILAAVADSAFPAAAIAVGRPGVIGMLKGYGYQTYDKTLPISENSEFDLASMTKVVATTTATMLLLEAGAISLDDKVVDYLPEFGVNDKDGVRIIHLLTHTSGLIPFRPYHRDGIHDRDEIIKSIMSDTLYSTPGEIVTYSDPGMITMGLVIEEVTGQSLDQFSRTHIFNPLGMCNTGFRTQKPGDVSNIVPTEYDASYRQRLVHGVVHDETAYSLGGTAGHAGLFSTAHDLARFATMLVSNGMIGDRQFLDSTTIALFTTRFTDGSQTERGIGWDLKSLEGYTSAGLYFGDRSFGHTGYTGTSIWIDPDMDAYAILLTNRVHPTRANRKISQVRPDFASAVGKSMVSDLQN